MRHIAPRHTLEVVLEVNLEVTLEHVLGIKTMTSLILDHIATAYLYLGINTGKKGHDLIYTDDLGIVTGLIKT